MSTRNPFVPPTCALSIGIVLIPDFTMLALAALVDTLRLAADEDDRSRPLRCHWQVMSDGGHPVRASNGLVVEPDSGLIDPSAFDYLAVVGGTMHRGLDVSAAIEATLQTAARAGVPLIGLCTGSFVLARAGLMRGRRACISWLHKDQLAAEFPDLTVVADTLFEIDRDRITCAGGTGVIHLASQLVDRHLGAGHSAKGLRIMLEDHPRRGNTPQPPPTIVGLEKVTDPRVRRAMLSIERSLDRRVPMELAATNVGVTLRQLNRLFYAAVGLSPSAFAHRLRLEQAHRMVISGHDTMTEIALACGYADASHFSRDYRRAFGCPPTVNRRATIGGAA